MQHGSITRRVPAFEPTSINPDPDRTMFPVLPPVEIAAIGANTVRLTVGGVSRVLDGIALCDAVNSCLVEHRRRTR